MPLDESLAFYWASIGFSAAGVVVFLWLIRTPKENPRPTDQDLPVSTEAQKPPEESAKT